MNEVIIRLSPSIRFVCSWPYKIATVIVRRMPTRGTLVCHFGTEIAYTW